MFTTTLLSYILKIITREQDLKLEIYDNNLVNTYDHSAACAVLCAVVAYRSTYCTYINASKAWIHQYYYLVALKQNQILTLYSNTSFNNLK